MMGVGARPHCYGTAPRRGNGLARSIDTVIHVGWKRTTGVGYIIVKINISTQKEGLFENCCDMRDVLSFLLGLASGLNLWKHQQSSQGEHRNDAYNQKDFDQGKTLRGVSIHGICPLRKEKRAPRGALFHQHGLREQRAD